MKPTIILSGIPGKMCIEISRAITSNTHKNKFSLASFGFTHEDLRGQKVDVADSLLTCEAFGYLESLLAKKQFEMPVLVDYSTPDSALHNISASVASNLPCVVGTTGYDLNRARQLVENSQTCAVLAPNMATPIVVLQAALSYLAREFPGALDGYNLSVIESHQSEKKDVSGTAKAFVDLLRQIGFSSEEEQTIRSVRDREEQIKLGVEEAHLKGHGYHWYNLTSEEDQVDIGFRHCINGRRVYADGTLKAVEFLSKKIEQGKQGIVYTMEDVLRGQ